MLLPMLYVVTSADVTVKRCAFAISIATNAFNSATDTQPGELWLVQILVELFE